ncbi:DUF3157 family protein [Photobacterium sp. SDRW27]|uniref:DUF3157 family protein n=1 Tax=Photobacterium obscurum TaxID=2829490 RepID=UPI00224442B3|nr:DUF3157 family protein [Photobacterium obscurum]MCW8331158.1 DUF3157 family protein [Photobacterium obscurum]
MKPLACLGGTLMAFAIATNAWAAPQVAQLEDGRQVILHDDFTWQYVVPVEQRKHQTAVQAPIDASTPAAAAATAAAVSPAVKVAVPAKVEGVHFIPGASQDIQQLNRSGIDVVLHSASYSNGELVIPTSLTNQSLESVVLVSLQVTIRNEQGRELARQEDKIWTSVKRMPETYFRPNTQQRGKPVKVSLPKAKGYFIEADIIEVEYW